MSLIHNMLVRELAAVALLFVVLVSFYVRYNRAVHKTYERTRERRMAAVVKSARIQLVLAAVLLAGVLVYDRVLPHWGVGAQAARVSESSKPASKKIAVDDASAKSASRASVKAEKAASAKATKAAKASKKAASVSAAKAASAAAASKQAASQSAASASAASASSTKAAASAASAKAASAKAASASAAKVDPKTKAVAAVQSYMSAHYNPATEGRIDGVSVIKYGTDYTGVPAYSVGLYQTQGDGSSVAVHMCFYYLNGTVAKAY